MIYKFNAEKDAYNVPINIFVSNANMDGLFTILLIIQLNVSNGIIFYL